MNQYYIFNDLESCLKALQEINIKKNFREGTNWPEPLKNQTKDVWAIPFDSQQIGDCEDILKTGELIDKAEAIKRGWYFGQFSGPFAREREKLEDVHFIFDALIANYGRPNFPATRSLILSFLSGCYYLKESLHKKITTSDFDVEFKNWWSLKKKEQDLKKELLFEYHVFMNTEKHGGASAGQLSSIRLEAVSYITTLIVTHHHPHANPQSMTISSEGAFMTAYQNTPMERRFPVGIHEAVYEIKVTGSPNKHLGQDINGASLLEQLSLIRNYYQQLLFDAETKIGYRNTQQIPSINFSGTQFMTVGK